MKLIIQDFTSISVFSLFRTSSRKSAFEYFTDLETISLQDPCIFQREKFRQLLPRLEENFSSPFFHRLPRYSFRRIPSPSFCLAAIDYCSRTKKKKDLSRCLMERFLAEWVLPLTEWILLNESRISISYLLCLNALLTSSPFSNPFFPVSTSHSFVSFFPYPNICTFLCNNCSRKSRVQQIRIFRTFSTNGQSFVSATLVNYSRAMHRESVTGCVKLSRSRDRVVCLNSGGIPVEIVCGRAISRSPPEIPSLLTIKGASSLETTREIKKEGKKRL